MVYLTFRILVFLLLAALLGILIGWWIARRGVEERLVKSDHAWRRRLRKLETENLDLRGQVALQTPASGDGAEATEGNADLRQENKRLQAQAEELASALAQARGLNKSSRRRISELEARLVEVERHMVNATDSSDQIKRLVAEKQDLEQRNQHCIAELTAVKSKLAQCEAQAEGLRSLPQLGEGVIGEPAAAGPEPGGLAASGGAVAPEGSKPPPKEEGVRPPFLSEPEGAPDDLQKIKGIGPKLESILNELGIYHFHQIAAFTPENITWVDGFLAFKGRINREKWVEQARKFAAVEAAAPSAEEDASAEEKKA